MLPDTLEARVQEGAEESMNLKQKSAHEENKSSEVGFEVSGMFIVCAVSWALLRLPVMHVFIPLAWLN